jgi:hypothetical protein
MPSLAAFAPPRPELPFAPTGDSSKEMFEDREIAELVRIAAAGGGFVFDASHRSTDELVRIAAASRSRGSRITFTGLGSRPTPEIVRIAAAGAGHVVFA